MITRAVRTLITHNVVTTRPSTGFKEIVDFMAAEGAGPKHALLIGRGRRAAVTKAAADVAADPMTDPAVTIGPDSPRLRPSG
jgi:hypothetical protein